MNGFFRELRHGWRNLSAATIGIAFGISNYTPTSSLFFRALETEFGWSKTVTASAMAVLPLTAVTLPIVGWLTDRFNVRRVAGTALVIVAGIYILLAHLTGSRIEYFLEAVSLSIIGCATGPVTYTRLIVTDFKEARGRALAVALVGIGVSGILLPPLIHTIMERFTWRGAYFAFSGLTVIGGIVAITVMQLRSLAISRRGEAALEIRAALADSAFWILGGAILAISAATIGLVSQFQSIFIEKGLTPNTGPWLLSLMGASVVVSRLVVGRLLDLPRPTRWAALVTLVAASGALLLLCNGGGLPVVVLGVICIGFSAGAELDLMAYFCSRLFSERHYSAIYGLLFGIHYCGMAIGGIGYGVIRDKTGSYVSAITCTAALLVVAAALFLRLGAARRSVQESP
jgi:predicted MFS family arabinose efflux permease